ncbi:hypothetical protein [Candidatus Tisiphia endosymbiont of Sialis lutaria]|uniref:hypothetical protein n=1 Tax=Candidatus Tisiphia endosymbiont of Sialis lutaria TaxID=2029164 RepID=UPI00312C777F
MDVKTVLNEVIKEHCPFIHNNRLNALLDVAEGLRYSQNLSLSAIGRNLSGDSKVKHKIKKVDRCIGNKHLYNEVDIVNSGEVGDVVTSRRLPTITKVILYFTLFGCKK